MVFYQKVAAGLAFTLCAVSAWADVIDQQEMEDGTYSANNIGTVSQPFNGVALYAKGGSVSHTARLTNVPGKFEITIYGASNTSQNAGISVTLGDRLLGSKHFSGTTPSEQTIAFQLEEFPQDYTLTFGLDSDSNGTNTLLDRYEISRTGDIPPPKPAPILPSKGAYETGQYRNLFAELGYSEAQVNQKVQAAYDQLFHSTDTDNKAIFIPDGDDMAYIWDYGNNDIRSEGMSYGMMMAVQMDRQDDFDKLWKWAHTYSLNKTGNMKGYFAWQVGTDHTIIDANPAPDGEEYFAMALFFASHRWGDDSGIFNYSEMANQILDDMYGNDQTRYGPNGQLEEFSLFDHEHKHIVFSPMTASDRNWTDPSYHVPAFYELWARWAQNNNDFWAEAAVASRAFFKSTAHEETGLVPDYAHFDGRGHAEFQPIKAHFQFDAWRTVANAGLDVYWWNKDPWETTYINKLQAFFRGQGMDNYHSLYSLDGIPTPGDKFQAPGIVAMNGMASIGADHSNAWDFVQKLWDTSIPEGQWRYYDGSLYIFGMLALSGNYKIYCPNNHCDTTPITNRAPIAYNDVVSVLINNSILIDVLANDNDNDKASLTIESISTPSKGVASLENGKIKYQTGTNEVGLDSFTYRISDGEFEATATVEINITEANAQPTDVASVSLNINAVELIIGNSETLNAIVLPTSATNKNVSWSSSNPSVATVTTSGKVTAITEGVTTISATTIDGNFKANAEVKVIKAAEIPKDDDEENEEQPVDTTPVTINVTSVVLAQNELMLNLQQSRSISATVYPANASDKSVTWQSSNSQVATVDSNGRITAVRAGIADISVTTTDGRFSDRVRVEVLAEVSEDVISTRISVSLSNVTLELNDTQQVNATVWPSNTTNKSLTWVSSDNSVAKVSNTGLITATGAGNATITITVTAKDSGKTALIQVSVSAPNETTKPENTTPDNSTPNNNNGSQSGATESTGGSVSVGSFSIFSGLFSLWLFAIPGLRRKR